MAEVLYAPGLRMLSGGSVRLTVDTARKLFSYNPLTGALTWRVNYGGRARPGALAGTLCRGYLRVKVLGDEALVHRIAWMLETGEMPPAIIDHADGDRGNNKWANLRAATASQNAFNTKSTRPRKKLPTGIFIDAASGLFRARVTKDGSTFASPLFVTELEAVTWRAAKAVELYGEFGKRAA